MRLPTSRTLRAKERMFMKDSYESFELEDVKFTKKTQTELSSPVSIVSELPTPPQMKPLPPSVPIVPPSNEALPLPAQAVWGYKHKLWLARCMERRTVEDIFEAYASSDIGPIDQRARLPIKSQQADRKAERKAERREQGLQKKYYDQRRTARRAALKEHQALLAAEQEEQERTAREAHDDLEEAEMEEADMKPTRPSRKTAARREKMRRSQRRAARDAKCLAPDDPIEWAALEVDAPKKPTRRTTPPRLSPKLISLLLSRESSGAALSDVFNCGVCLSSAAAKDLRDMWLQICLHVTLALRLDQKQEPPERSEMTPKRLAKSRELQARRKASRQKMPKGSGAHGYLRQRSMLKAQGKRNA